MQNKNNRKDTMSKIRMNTELRNKLFNKIKNVFENEDTQEREGFLRSREIFNTEQSHMRVHLQKQLLREHIHQKMFLFLELSKRNMEDLVML